MIMFLYVVDHYSSCRVSSCKVQVFEGEEAKEKGTEGKSRCFGFVNFEDHESAVKAIESLNGTVSEIVIFR